MWATSWPWSRARARASARCAGPSASCPTSSAIGSTVTCSGAPATVRSVSGATGGPSSWRTRRRAAAGRGAAGCRPRGVALEIDPAPRRVAVLFNAEERVDFRDLVRDLAHEFHSRIEMRQIGARDTSKLMRGIGPCGRQLCCSSHLKNFDPISVKMAKGQDMPLTDSRLLGNCGRLKCCLLYEFSTYEQLRKHLPKVGTACQADCGGQGCMTGKVRSLRVLKQAVVVGFQDGTEAEVPLEALTWEGRPHIQPL